MAAPQFFPTEVQASTTPPQTQEIAQMPEAEEPTPPPTPDTKTQAELDKLKAETENLKTDTQLKQRQIEQIKDGRLWWGKFSGLSGPLTALVAAGGVYLTLRQLRQEREKQRSDHEFELERTQQNLQADRERRDDGNFQSIANRLGNEQERVRLGAAMELLTFSRSEYLPFHQRVFDLAVGFLRQRQVNPEDPRPTPYDQALIDAFLAVLPTLQKANDQYETRNPFGEPTLVNARGVHLDGAELAADLSHVDFSEGSFTKTRFHYATLVATLFQNANLRQANLSELSGNGLWATLLHGANLEGATIRCPANEKMLRFHTVIDRGASLKDTVLLVADFGTPTFNDNERAQLIKRGAKIVSNQQYSAQQ